VACREKLRLVGIAGSRCLSTVVVTAVAVGLAAGGFAYLAYGQAQERPSQEPPRLAADRHTDPRIAKAIEEVSADRIRQTIEKLVSFGNRSTIPRRTRIRSKPARASERRGSGSRLSSSATPKSVAAAWR